MQKFRKKLFLFVPVAILALSLSGCTDFFDKFITPMYTIEQRPASDKVIDLSDADAATEAMEELLDNLTRSNAADTAKALAKIAGNQNLSPAVRIAARKNAVNAAAGVIDLLGILSSVVHARDDDTADGTDIMGDLLNAMSGSAGEATAALAVIASIATKSDDPLTAETVEDDMLNLLELPNAPTGSDVYDAYTGALTGATVPQLADGLGKDEALPLLVLTLAALSVEPEDFEGDATELILLNLLGLPTTYRILDSLNENPSDTTITDALTAAKLVPLFKQGEDSDVTVQFAVPPLGDDASAEDAEAHAATLLRAAVMNALFSSSDDDGFDISFGGGFSLKDTLSEALGLGSLKSKFVPE